VLEWKFPELPLWCNW